MFFRLDYTGITLLIVGSFIPWIFYGFYCRFIPKIIYISMIFVLGIAAMIVSLWDRFAEPRFRPLRAGIFAAMGLSGMSFCVSDDLSILYIRSSTRIPSITHWRTKDYIRRSVDALADANGIFVSIRRCTIRDTNTGTFLSRKMRYLGSLWLYLIL